MQIRKCVTCLLPMLGITYPSGVDSNAVPTPIDCSQSGHLNRLIYVREVPSFMLALLTTYSVH